MKICPLCHNEMKLFPGEWQQLYTCSNMACGFFSEKLPGRVIGFLNEHIARQSAVIAAQAELIEALEQAASACDPPKPEKAPTSFERWLNALDRAKAARAKLAEVQNAKL